MTIAELEMALKTVTDRLDLLDPLITKQKFMYFRCMHSQRFYPADYVSQWGRKYGIGIGGDPRSECLDSMYEILPRIGREITQMSQIMHPCRVSGAPIDVVYLTAKAPEGMLLIPALKDRKGEKRAKIIREVQLKHPESKIKVYEAMFNRDYNLEV